MAVKNWILLNNQVMSKDAEGNYDLDKDKQAVRSYFLEYVNKYTWFFHDLREKIDYLIENNYYIDFYKKYQFSEIEAVFDLVYAKKFRFPSFMSAFKFYQNYALRDNTGEFFLERYEDRIAVVALFLADGDQKKALEYAEMMINQEYQPATPTFLNAGKLRAGQLVSCFLDEVGDNLTGIGYAIDEGMKLSSIGGGVAYNFSKLRARGEAIKNIDGRASGVMPVLKIMEDVFSYANQLGQRPGAGAAYLNVFHWDIEEFLDSKKVNVDEKIRIKSLSIGVIAPGKFMELVAQDQDMYVFAPLAVRQAFGVDLDEMDMGEMYDQLVAHPQVKKRKLDARQLLVRIAQVQKESGYPYLFFKDNANKDHALRQLGSVKFSNLCTEIMQLSEVSDIGQYYEKDQIRRGISCNLGSLNIVNVMENKRIKQAVKGAIDALTQVSDITDIDIVPSIKKANEELHSVGLGAMNLHGYLVKNQIAYESREALDFCKVVFMMMNFYSLERSMEIAKARKTTFKDFAQSDYATGEYFTKYLTKDFVPQTDKVKELFAGIKIPTIDDWTALADKVKKYGLYNAYRLAIAPTQSVSYIQSATSSIMPIVDPIEVREYGDSTTFYPMPFLTNDNIFYYKSAYDMDQKNVIKLVAVVQRHIDQGISTILHTNSDETTRDIAKYYIYAHKMGLKSLYYTRTRKSTVETCLSCSV